MLTDLESYLLDFSNSTYIPIIPELQKQTSSKRLLSTLELSSTIFKKIFCGLAASRAQIFLPRRSDTTELPEKAPYLMTEWEAALVR